MLGNCVFAGDERIRKELLAKLEREFFLSAQKRRGSEFLRRKNDEFRTGAESSRSSHNFMIKCPHKRIKGELAEWSKAAVY